MSEDLKEGLDEFGLRATSYGRRHGWSLRLKGGSVSGHVPTEFLAELLILLRRVRSEAEPLREALREMLGDHTTGGTWRTEGDVIARARAALAALPDPNKD